ncbi:MAG TPA: hypothetical protein PKA55_07875 [Rhodoblastus sp.]|nr:hypothetical protein [Rhodoblastus sp.]
MSLWLVLHLLALGAWIGCIATETIVEHSVRNDAERDYIADAHWPIDLYVETPAFLLVAISGGMLLRAAAADRLVWTMAGVGLLAIACNAACVTVVHRRRAARRRGDAPAYARLDDIQHKLGALLVALIVVALGAGIGRMV